MATWPTSNPSATTTDAASDSISGARGDINQTIDNIIEVVDMFNIPASPTDNYILKYNASTGVFDMEADAGGTISSVTNFADNRLVTASGATTLNGEANLTFNGSILHIDLDSAGAFGLLVQNDSTTGSGIESRLGSSSTLPTTGDHLKFTSETTGGSQGEVLSVDAQGSIKSTVDQVRNITVGATRDTNLWLEQSGTDGILFPQILLDSDDANASIGVYADSGTSTYRVATVFDPMEDSAAYQSGDAVGDFAVEHRLKYDAGAAADEIQTFIIGANNKHTYNVYKSGSQSDAKADMEFIVNSMSIDSVLDMNSNKITSVTDPAAAQDAATKAYVDANVGSTTTINNNADNRIITGSGTANTLEGESTLLYNGTSLSNTTAPTFTAASTPIQLNGTQPNPGGYYASITVNNGTTRGAYNYSARTAGGGGPNADRHIFFFDLDDDFSARPSGAYQGDQNVWINANHSSDRADLYFDGFSTAGISAYGHGGNSYAIQALEFNGSTIKLQSGGTNIISIDSDSVDITQDVVITDTEQLKFGTTTTIDKDEISTTGGMTVNVDSNNSGNEAFTIQSAGTDVMSFQRGPGGDAEMTVTGDGFFIKDEDDNTQFSMDMSSGSQTGINVIRSDENKSLSFTLKTDDDDDTGNYDGAWNFVQAANEKALVLERVDGSAVEIFEIRDSAGVATAAPVDIFEFKIPPVIPSYTIAALPTTVVAGALALVTDATPATSGSAIVLCFFDGSNWKLSNDPIRTVV